MLLEGLDHGGKTDFTNSNLLRTKGLKFIHLSVNVYK